LWVFKLATVLRKQSNLKLNAGGLNALSFDPEVSGPRGRVSIDPEDLRIEGNPFRMNPPLCILATGFIGRGIRRRVSVIPPRDVRFRN
jgi:hypothetical protein